MAEDLVKNEYNTFTEFPNTSYNIIKHLVYNEDELWKYLKYPNPDAWKSPILSMQEKIDMIYGGQPDITSYNVFPDLGQDNSWTVETCILRIAPLKLIPEHYTHGMQTIAFEVYAHYKIGTLSNYTNRVDAVTQRLISILNGADIPGVGRLFFDYKASPQCKSVVIGSIPYKGRATIMCNYNLG